MASKNDILFNFEIVLSDQMIWKMQIYNQHTVNNITVYIPRGNYLTNPVHGQPENALASKGPNEDPIAIPSICMYNMFLNIKYGSLVAKDRRSLNSLFFEPWTMELFLKRLLVQISMVSLNGVLLKRESLSKIPVKLLESCSAISVAKLNESLTQYLLVVNDSKIGTKYFASLYVGVCKADKIGVKAGQPSTHFFYVFYNNCILFQV